VLSLPSSQGKTTSVSAAIKEEGKKNKKKNEGGIERILNVVRGKGYICRMKREKKSEPSDKEKGTALI